jgi:hypothetical protein
MSKNESRPGDMRKQARVEVSGTVRVKDRQEDRDIGQLVNISQDGMMLLMTQPILDSTILQLSLEFTAVDGERTAMHVGVESLWCNKGSDENQYWAGFYIIDISEQDRARIESLLD